MMAQFVHVMSMDTLLMHPLMAEVRLPEQQAGSTQPPALQWRCNAPQEVRAAAAFRVGMPGRTNSSLARGGLSLTELTHGIRRWARRHALSGFQTRCALLDMRLRRVWCVDFVCELRGRCALMCVFLGERRALTPMERRYMLRLRRLATETYRADVRVVALRAMNNGRVFSHEIP